MKDSKPYYEGHLPDGSGIQKHSAGGLYPCVLYQQEVNGVRLHGVLRGDCDSGPVFKTYEDAVERAEKLNASA